MRILQIIIVLFLFMACGTTKQAAQTNLLDEDAKVVISYKQTMGRNLMAPLYEIELYSNKQMFLNAQKNLDVEGKYMRTLTEKEYNQLIEVFTEADFFNFEDFYISKMRDLPSRYLYFSYDGKEKKVHDYDDAPEKLKELEYFVQSYLDRVGWIKMAW
ncbi:MAG: hypothetical protein JEZ09_03540 [Salinivirgaceae bacterium]|nr:hypothetical protein [Salinivirgaceae bacterium]